jgi:manganese/zinc/iron transport system permease protein
LSDELTILLTAGLVATATGLLGPLLVLKRVALMSDAVSHAVLPGIVAVYLLAGTRASLPVIAGAGLFAMVCVLGVEGLRGSGLLRADAAIGLVFPTLFALGVLGITVFAGNVHLDLDATIYGEIAFAPFRTLDLAGVEVARSIVIMGAVAAINLLFLALLWKELKVSTFDPSFARVNGFSPRAISRLLLAAVALTAVTAFESVGVILVVTMLIVPAAAAYLLTDRLLPLIALSVAIGWLAAGVGQASASALDTSIAGSMGLVATLLFVAALLGSPRFGLIARRRQRRRRRRRIEAELAALRQPAAGLE